MEGIRELGDVFNQEKESERKEVIKSSGSVVKPDTRILPPSRQGKKQVATWVSPEAHQEVKIAAAMRNCSIEEFVRAAVNSELVAMGRPPIA